MVTQRAYVPGKTARYPRKAIHLLLRLAEHYESEFKRAGSGNQVYKTTARIKALMCREAIVALETGRSILDFEEMKRRKT